MLFAPKHTIEAAVVSVGWFSVAVVGSAVKVKDVTVTVNITLNLKDEEAKVTGCCISVDQRFCPGLVMSEGYCKYNHY